MKKNDKPIKDLIRMRQIQDKLGKSIIDRDEIDFVKASISYEWPVGHACYYYLMVDGKIEKTLDNLEIRQALHELYRIGSKRVKRDVIETIFLLDRQEFGSW